MPDSEIPVTARSGVNFINILRVPFSYQSYLRSFSLVTVWLCDFLAKAVRKMLMKLFTVRRNCFSCRPKCVEANEGIIPELSPDVLQIVASIIVTCIRHRRQNESKYYD